MGNDIFAKWWSSNGNQLLMVPDDLDLIRSAAKEREIFAKKVFEAAQRIERDRCIDICEIVATERALPPKYDVDGENAARLCADRIAVDRE